MSRPRWTSSHPGPEPEGKKVGPLAGPVGRSVSQGMSEMARLACPRSLARTTCSLVQLVRPRTSLASSPAHVHHSLAHARIPHAKEAPHDAAPDVSAPDTAAPDVATHGGAAPIGTFVSAWDRRPALRGGALPDAPLPKLPHLSVRLHRDHQPRGHPQPAQGHRALHE